MGYSRHLNTRHQALDISQLKSLLSQDPPHGMPPNIRQALHQSLKDHNPARQRLI